MDEGIIEGCEYASDAEDEFTCLGRLLVNLRKAVGEGLADLLGLGDLERCSLLRHARPSSWEA